MFSHRNLSALAAFLEELLLIREIPKIVAQSFALVYNTCGMYVYIVYKIYKSRNYNINMRNSRRVTKSIYFLVWKGESI